MGRPEPNAALERLYRETGWSLRQWVQAVNRIGTEAGTPLRYQEPSAHQWLKGHMPKAKVQPLILEAFSRKLGRPIPPEEAGFPSPSHPSNTRPSIVEALLHLGRHDMDPSRRGLIGASLYSVALTVPNWPDVVGRVEAVRTGQTQRIGMRDVDMVADMTERLWEVDFHFGGGHSRPMAASFLVNAVVPFLRAEATEEVRRAMLSAAADVCYQLGYMAVDEGVHGLAQQYYAKSLELAGAAENQVKYCRTLRGMSVQAVNLGHGSEAMRLADASAEAAHRGDPRMRAFIAGQQAHAAARVGRRDDALRLIGETERALDRASSRERTVGSYGPSALHYHISTVCQELGDLPGAVRAMTDANRLRDPDARRTRLWHRARLAELQLRVGHLEAACATGHTALDEYPGVKSGRVDNHLRAMFSLLHPHLTNPTAHHLHNRARTLVPAAVLA